jgi:hypothetical protein
MPTDLKASIENALKAMSTFGGQAIPGGDFRAALLDALGYRRAKNKEHGLTALFAVLIIISIIQTCPTHA